MSEPQLRVLLVDDEASLREPLTRYLKNEHGFQVDSAATAVEAWQMVVDAQGQYDVALVDDMLGSGQRGLDVTRQIKATYPDIEVIVFAAWGGDWVLEYLQAGAYRHLSKPFDPQELGFLIQTAVEHSRIRKEKDLLRSLYEAGNAVISIMEPRAVLEVIVRQACQALKGWWAKVVLIADDGTPTEQVSVGFDHELDLHDLIRFDGISQQVMTSGKPYQIPDVQQELNEVNPSLLRDGVGAAICIPLRLRGKNIGVIWIHYREPRRFLPPEIDALQIYAAQAASAYDNARLLDQLDKARHAARVVAQVTVLNDLERTLDSIVRTTQEILCCDVITIFSYDQDDDKIGHRASRGVRYPERMPTVGKLGQRSVFWKVLSMKKPYYVAEDAQHDPVTVGQFVREEGIVSSISFPLKFGDRKVGALFVNYCTPHHFTESEITTIGLLADQAAVAIRNAQLLAEFEQQANTLAALYEAGQEVSATLDLKLILNQIVLQSWRLARQYGKNPTLCNITLKEGQKLQFAATYPEDSLTRLQQKIAPEIDLERGYDGRIGISGRVALSGRSALIGDVRQHPDYIEIDPETRSVLTVPITFGDRIIGVINVEHPDVDAFDEQDQQALELLAAQAATAIENARKYEELLRTKGLVGSRTALAWMGMISNTWRHTIEGHAINIGDYVQLLRRDAAAGADGQAIERRLNAIERLVRKILEKPITPPISNEEGVESVSINNLVRKRVRQRWQYSPYNAIKCQWDLALDDKVTVRASPEWLKRVLDILLDNAVEAMAASAVKELTVATQQANGHMLMTLSDTGPGIPPQVQDQLFQKPVDKPKGGKGLGMGLLVAQMIAQTYGGDIYVGHTGPHGTAMVLELPWESDVGGTKESDRASARHMIPAFDIGEMLDDLRRENKELKKLDQKRTEFLSTVSHELRTPLTPVQSCIENLLSGVYGPLTGRQQTRLEIALASTREEARLIENLLDLARIEEGRATLEQEHGSIAKIVRDVARVFEYDASLENVTLTMELPDGDPLEAIIDVGKVKQVLTNLISNALKFTGEGGRIIVAALDQDHDIEVRIKDTGIGIPEKEFTKIFDRFYQVDSSLTRKVGGTGIGLSIAKEYVEMHEGRIWVQSEVDKGSTFFFTLPKGSIERG